MLLPAQQDPGKWINAELADATGKKLTALFEIRQRVEDRTGILFGRDRDIAADFIRTRFGLSYRPAPWIKLHGLAQDTRVAAYGAPAPGSVKDPLDLQEGYVELFSSTQKGFGATIGRQMIGYGDTRLIGSPQWAYAARTWDTARLYYVTARMRLEVLHISPIVPRGDGFNKPILGDRIWGTYSTFQDVLGKNLVDAYILRHDQNRPGGFTGVGTYGVNVFGTRWAMPLPKNFRLTTEGVLQNGHNGPLKHRAAGFVSQLGYKTKWLGKPLDLANEYKYATGTDPDSGRSGTFDQLYPAAHDKLGHVDLIGWRNIHNLRSITTWSLRPKWQWILMYNASWLVNPRDSLYNIQGRPIVRSATGRDGRWVGQEIDLYTNLQLGPFTIAGGFGQFVPGTFIKNTTPGAWSRLLYLSTQYSF